MLHVKATTKPVQGTELKFISKKTTEIVTNKIDRIFLLLFSHHHIDSPLYNFSRLSNHQPFLHFFYEDKTRMNQSINIKINAMLAVM